MRRDKRLTSRETREFAASEHNATDGARQRHQHAPCSRHPSSVINHTLHIVDSTTTINPSCLIDNTLPWPDSSVNEQNETRKRLR
jgi:hypothetical protein